MHLRLHLYITALPRNVVVGAVDVCAGCAQAVVEREGLIDLPRHMQPHPPIDAPEVGIKVVGVPAEGDVGGTLVVGGSVVYAHGKHVIVVAELYTGGNVDAVCGDPVFIQPIRSAVQINLAGLAHAFKFDEHLGASGGGGEFEVLPIPANSLIRPAIASAVVDND